MGLQIEERYIERANSVLEYQNDAVVARFASGYNCSIEEANDAFTAFKQFVGVCCATPEQRKTVSETVDEFWHTFLIFTRQYDDFCTKYLGSFLHHEPKADKESPAYYLATRETAESLFGTLDEKVWPKGPPTGSRCISGGFCVRPKCMT